MKPESEFSSSDDSEWDDLFRAYRPVPLPDDFASRVLDQTSPRGPHLLFAGLAMALLLGSIGLLLTSISSAAPALSGLVRPPASLASFIADLLQTLGTISAFLRLLADCAAHALAALQQTALYGGGLLMSATFLLGLLVFLHIRSIHPIAKP
jgi:hypothetical protein